MAPLFPKQLQNPALKIVFFYVVKQSAISSLINIPVCIAFIVYDTVIRYPTAYSSNACYHSFLLSHTNDIPIDR
jgi:hypothetical protein